MLNRHRCTFFGRFGKSGLLQHLETQLGEEEYQNLSEQYSRLSRRTGERLDNVYWSWQLVNFRLVQSRLINIPILALWSDRPFGTVWAPQRPRRPRPESELPDGADTLLEGAPLEKLDELIFKRVLRVFRIGQAIPKLAHYTSRPPVFYFVDHANPPQSVEDYAGSGASLIKPLFKKCLGRKGFSKKEVAWGILEQDSAARDLVALRSEVTDGYSRYLSRYLLLRAGPGPSPDQEDEKLEKDLERVVRNLTYLEFKHSDEAEDLYVNVESIRERQPIWKGVLDEVRDSATSSMHFLSSLGRSDHGPIYDEFRELHVLQRSRIKARLDKDLDEHTRAQSESKNYRVSTEEYLQQEEIAFSSLSRSDVPDLHKALLDPFPYKHINRELESDNNRRNLLNKNVKETEDLSGTVNAVLESTEERARGHSSLVMAALAVLVGFLAVAGLAQFVPGSQLGDPQSVANGNSEPKLNLLRSVVELSTLELIVQGVIIAGIIVTVTASVVLLLYILYLSINRFRLHRFGNKVQKLWTLASADTSQGFAKKEKTDEKATVLLRELFEMIEPTNDRTSPLARFFDNYVWRPVKFLWWTLRCSWRILRVHRPSRPEWVTNWLKRASYIRYRNELFILGPKIIPSPRVLCIIRHNSNGFLQGSMISERDFRESLEAIGWKKDEIRSLDRWLSEPDNETQIQEMDVHEFAAVLKERGVTADPEKRTPEKWEGLLKKSNEPTVTAVSSDEDTAAAGS